MNRLEDKLLDDVKEGKEIDIERALLVLSGLQTEEEIAMYKLKLDIIDAGFQEYMGARSISEDNPKDVAEALHNYLWKDNKERYDDSAFFLTKVIDAQSSLENEPVGNCVGLTAPYTVLGLRHNLDLSVLIDTEHVISKLKIADEEGINIENTLPEGFDKATENDLNYFYEHRLCGLLAITLGNRGSAKYDSWDDQRALDNWAMAKQVDDKISGIYFNVGCLKSEMGLSKEAIKEFDKAIELNCSYALAFYYRAYEKFKLSDYKSALEDLEMIVAWEPTNTEIIEEIIGLKNKLGDIKGAIEDYEWLVWLDPRPELYPLGEELKRLGKIRGIDNT